MMKFVTLVFVLIAHTLFSQEIKPLNGVKNSKAKIIALKNVSIMVSPGKTIERGTVLISDDQIINVGSIVIIPSDALVLDYEGKILVPAFIESNSGLGIPKANGKNSFYPQLETTKTGAYYWNECIHPEINAADLYTFDEKGIEDYLKMGFGLVSVHQQDGLAQGSGAVYSLGIADYNKQLIKTNAASYFSFRKGVSNQSYPSSQMGSIALLRQVFYDLKWYQNSSKKDLNLSLQALADQVKGQLIFQSEDRYEILRAQKIATEFGFQFTCIGSGNEYQILDELKALKAKLILPINFPAAYDVKDPYISKSIPLSDLKHWELAPANPGLLSREGLKFAITSSGSSPSDFWKNIRKAIENGLSQEDALAALTSIPAEILGIDQQFGTLEDGKRASFMVYNSNPFESEAVLLESWLLGEQRIFSEQQALDVRGKYNMILDNEYLSLEISGSKEKPTAKIKKTKVATSTKGSKRKKITTTTTDTLEVSCYVSVIGNDITLQFDGKDIKWEGSVSLHAKFNPKFGVMEGDGILSNGIWVKWNAIKNENNPKDSKSKSKTESKKQDLAVWYPNMAFGFEKKPQQETIVIENVTLWTNEKEGIVGNGALVIEKGKIKYVGDNSNYAVPNNATVIDGKGKHVTSGIIDEHSHIAISRGVNEGGQAISAEVSIGDVVKADDIDIYRQLSGGVTAAQLLHGSANPVGGQSALIKLKWGHQPNEMLIPDAPKFIKFALGENVKQANWGDFNTVRFPQTRMGVEQIYYDAFDRAKKYDLEKKNHPNEYRTDLELEVLLEILKQERFITCHSYIQSEINMLMHVADSMNFKLNTFTHILEGYKVADKMKAHGAGASTFADWWAYKFEVNDAIPQNAAILNQMGVITAINSDDAEMGRRLNQEAAKTVKYGGVSETDAWKMVTLNPAKLLHLDERMGSLKVGKDADIVLWSANPLSIEARVELTIVDGEILFDAGRDIQLQALNARERARIISKMLESNEKGGDSKAFFKKKAEHFHCDTIGEEATTEQNNH